jgi:uncharacterized protein (TIGR02246 family)
MKRPISLVTGLALALTLSILSAQTTDPSPMEDRVQALADRWAAAYNTHDRAAIAALYTDDAHLYVHGSARIMGRQAIADFWEEDFQVSNPITLLDVTNSVEGIDMILVHGNYQVVDRNTGARLGEGRFAHIWHREANGQWQLHSDLWNQPY